VNPKRGKVWPTSVPILGSSTIIAAFAGAIVGADAAVGSGSAVATGTVVESGMDVGSDEAVIAGTVVESDASFGGATGAASTVEVGLEAGRASAAEVPHPNNPITTAIKGRASSRDIPDYPQPSDRTGKYLGLAEYMLPHQGLWT